MFTHLAMNNPRPCPATSPYVAQALGCPALWDSARAVTASRGRGAAEGDTHTGHWPLSWAGPQGGEMGLLALEAARLGTGGFLGASQSPPGQGR